MNFLVTGAAGFIGFHVVKHLIDRGDSVFGIDSINDYYDSTLKFARLLELGIGNAAKKWNKTTVSAKYPQLRFTRMSLEDRSRIKMLFENSTFDRVVNLAAQPGVRYSIDHPYDYIESNIVGFLNILEGCRHTKVGHLIYASSSSVYGLNDSRPFATGDNTDHPASLYAATKKANELMAHTYSHLYGIPTTGLRFFTVYGPWGRPDMAYYKFANAIVKGDTIDVYNNGVMLRDFTYIDDVVEGVMRISDLIPIANSAWDSRRPDPSSSSAPYSIYNIGNSSPVKLMDFITTIEKYLGKTAKKNFLPMQPGDVYATEANIDSLYGKVNWRPITSIETGLKLFSEWYMKYHTKEI